MKHYLLSATYLDKCTCLNSRSIYIPLETDDLTKEALLESGGNNNQKNMSEEESNRLIKSLVFLTAKAWPWWGVLLWLVFMIDWHPSAAIIFAANGVILNAMTTKNIHSLFQDFCVEPYTTDSVYANTTNSNYFWDERKAGNYNNLTTREEAITSYCENICHDYSDGLLISQIEPLLYPLFWVALIPYIIVLAITFRAVFSERSYPDITYKTKLSQLIKKFPSEVFLPGQSKNQDQCVAATLSRGLSN